MAKKLLAAIGFFMLAFLPVVGISFFANTVFHQIFFFIAFIAIGCVTYYLNQLKFDCDRLNQEVFFKTYELKKAKEALASCLVTDTQTQTYNERLLDSRLTEECDRAKRYNRSLSILMVALDSLSDPERSSQANLHELIVQEVAEFLKESTRSVDVIIRKGQDRFIAILPETPLDPARIVAERIRFAVDKKTFRIENHKIKATVSISVVQFSPSAHNDKNDLLTSLEEMLGRAQKVGPNQITALNGPFGK